MRSWDSGLRVRAAQLCWKLGNSLGAESVHSPISCRKCQAYRGHAKRQKSRNLSASKWTKKLESLSKRQPKMSLKETFILTPFHFKIVSICTITGFKPPYNNKVRFCAYTKYHFVLLTSDKVPQPGAREAHAYSKFSPQTLHQSGPNLWGCPREGYGPKTTARSWRILVLTAATQSNVEHGMAVSLIRLCCSHFMTTACLNLFTCKY